MSRAVMPTGDRRNQSEQRSIHGSDAQADDPKPRFGLDRENGEEVDDGADGDADGRHGRAFDGLSSGGVGGKNNRGEVIGHDARDESSDGRRHGEEENMFVA